MPLKVSQAAFLYKVLLLLWVLEVRHGQMQAMPLWQEEEVTLRSPSPAVRWCRVTINMMIAGVHLDDWVWVVPASVPRLRELTHLPLAVDGSLVGKN